MMKTKSTRPRAALSGAIRSREHAKEAGFMAEKGYMT